MQFVRRLLAEQRKRAVASIMTAIEAQTKALPEQQQRELRNRVMAAINQYHDTCLDCLKSSINDGTQANEHAVEVIAKFNNDLKKGLG